MSEEEFDLEMKFDPVLSNGGPFDDAAYTAGFEMGRMDAVLQYRVMPEIHTTIRVENRQQADLIAMRNKYKMDVMSEHEEWLEVLFSWAIDRGIHG